MQILSIYDTAFRKYGKVIKNIDFSGLVKEMEKTPVPEGVVYEPSVEALEGTSAMEACRTIYFGEMPVQIGYCNGHNSLLNAVEYHRKANPFYPAIGQIPQCGCGKKSQNGTGGADGICADG